MSKFETQSKEANARITGILSIVFAFIPIVGLVLGIIATQKGRGVSDFAVNAGKVGIALSVVLVIIFALWRFNDQRSSFDQCVSDKTSGYTFTSYDEAVDQCR